MNAMMVLRVALKALRVNKLRTALTMLGMIIGVAAVIAMISIGAGAQQAPDWIPNYPGGRTEGLANLEAKGEKSGTFTLRTADTPDTVLSFYESKLKDAGFEVQKASLSYNGAPSGTLSASAERRQLSITAAAQDGETQALVTYNEKP